jgi:hypothetical protein
MHESRRDHEINQGGHEQQEEVVEVDQTLPPDHQRGDVTEPRKCPARVGDGDDAVSRMPRDWRLWGLPSRDAL